MTLPDGRDETAAERAVPLLRASGAVVRLPVQGDSMAPLLEDGDAVRVRTGVAPRFGHVVVAWTPGGLVVHRVIRRKGDRLDLCGDNARASDVPLSTARVLGRAVAVEGRRRRRLDRPAAVAAGWMVAAYARARAALGGRPARPRPARLARLYVRVADRWPPPSSVEDRLTLLLAAPPHAVPAFERARRLAAGAVDWQRVADRAHRGQIGPQVFAGARRLPGADHLPPAALDRLRLQHVGNAARTLRVREILHEIASRLEAEGVRALAHKGLALAMTVYPDPALRIMGDLDLCVRDEERRRAEAAVRDIRSALVRANPDRRSRRGFHVELDGTAHHDVDPSLCGGGRWRAETLDWDGIWARARPGQWAPATILVPAATDLLLTLVANAVRRGFTPVRLVVDVAWTVERLGAEIDWAALTAELRRTRLDRRSWPAFGLAAAWCGSVVPAELLEPPADLRPAAYEIAMLDWKTERPFARLPTRVLWAGSPREAVAAAAHLLRSGRA